MSSWSSSSSLLYSSVKSLECDFRRFSSTYFYLSSSNYSGNVSPELSYRDRGDQFFVPEIPSKLHQMSEIVQIICSFHFVVQQSRWFLKEHLFHCSVPVISYLTLSDFGSCPLSMFILWSEVKTILNYLHIAELVNYSSKMGWRLNLTMS